MHKNKCPETEPSKIAAWGACLEWAIFDKDIVAEYEKSTGNILYPYLNSFDNVIDVATGGMDMRVNSFITWFNKYIWGDSENEPKRNNI